MATAVLRLKRDRDRARWHPWIFKGEVADVSDVTPGDEVTVVDAAGAFVGRGFYNPRPALCCRIVTRRDQPVDVALLRQRLEAAVGLRTGPGGVPGLARLVWSEADGLPGLVVDRYGDVLVVQCLTLAMARRRADLARELRGILGTLPVWSADDPGTAALEGFAASHGWLDQAGPARVLVHEDGVALHVTLGTGQKTGLYLDQRLNRVRVGGLAAGRDVLDVFSYTAGFACHALLGGARRALCIESSPEAVAGARDNLAANAVADRSEVLAASAFDELRRLDRQDARFGLIVLDPPPFARHRGSVDAAARGYKEVNLRAMRLLAPGGLLATFSCSHHVSEAHFEEICRAAAADAGVALRVVDRLTQASDHPVLLAVPETRYLKGLLVEAVQAPAPTTTSVSRRA